MRGAGPIESPFLIYWRAQARAWAILGLPCPSLGEAMASWEAGRRAWREAPALYGKVNANG